MKLYGVPAWGSAIVETMLALVGEPYDFVDVEGFDRPDAAQDRLAAVNPLRQVPTLVLDDGEVLTETAAIALWLADRHAGLAPAPGTVEHRRFLRLLIWIVANVYPTFTYGDYPERWAPSAQDELTAATNAHRERLYRWLEEQVVGPYVLGEQASALDCYAVVMIDWRPGREWFAENTPRLFDAAQLMRRNPKLAAVLAHNKLIVD
ncbi:glutathione S-transferase family protein [Sphingomonas yabuuchiae]|uniref:GST-like protein n=1 Tax=Sphingomonas yabuuchiae TaxID=172044 RepID=A0AA40ZZJ5_9SPHN|nr:glutathione S-transferase [Sphingomonas yabuuchiae]MBB4610755.1 GST-like protein [Sphingomonas yabuuchiae]MBN3557243.1 glutathione S-transferase [Sphingomonas yabuuchiae]